MGSRNWAGNLEFHAARVHEPTTLDQVRRVVVDSDRVGVVGTGHSFNDIADTTGDLISTARLSRIAGVDDSAATVTVGAGVRYGELGPYLHERGWALRNLASLPHLTVAGAVATATHGSGPANQNLSAAVRGIELFTANGELLGLDGRNPRLPGMVVGLGALGLVTSLTLEIVPTFDVQQDVYLDLPFATAVDHLSEILDSAYSVSLFTRWAGPTVDQVWVKRMVGTVGPVDAPSSRWSANRSMLDVHPIPDLAAAPCTPQRGVPGPWFERLPHFRLEHTPSGGDELQSEYLVSRADGPAALAALSGLAPELNELLLTSEIRAIAADDLWLSPCHQQGSVAFHFTWQPRWSEVRALLPRIETTLAPFSPKPHWGKLFTLDAATIRSRFERFDDFAALVHELDPSRKFRNRFLDELLG